MSSLYGRPTAAELVQQSRVIQRWIGAE